VKARRRGSLLLEEETAQQQAGGSGGNPAVGMEQNVSVSACNLIVVLCVYWVLLFPLELPVSVFIFVLHIFCFSGAGRSDHALSQESAPEGQEVRASIQ